MIGAISAGVVGAAALAKGIASARAARNTNTNPTNTIYGGSAENQAALQAQYQRGIDQGNTSYQAGTAGLTGAQGNAQQIFGLGQNVFNQALANPTPVSTLGQQSAGIALQNYVPGQVAAAQQRQALDQGALANLSAGNQGGAMGLRNALVANAGANTTAAQNLAAERAQEQQAYLAAQMQQGNQVQQNAFAQQQAQQGLLSLGGQLSATGNGQAASAAGNIASTGLANQAAYLGQQATAYGAQNSNQANYNSALQNNAIRQQQNQYNAAGSYLNQGMTGIGSAIDKYTAAQKGTQAGTGTVDDEQGGDGNS